MKAKSTFPEKGTPASMLMEQLQHRRAGDTNWNNGKTFGFVYHPGSEYTRISEEYLKAFLYESTLNPTAFPSLKNFEKEVVSMARDLMYGDRHVAGSVTTGGTESIFLALRVAREMAREQRGRPIEGENTGEVVLPSTAHPAFIKACNYLDLKAVVVPVSGDGRVDPEAMQAAITNHTILMAASAPCFPYGVVDPIPRLGKIARKHKLLFHVDACMGGFMLPFLEENGEAVPAFDFRVPGVTSVSLDAHKYGYAPKGVSIILYRNRELRRKQFFIHTEWPGGIFASTTFSGTRSGGPLAGCWAMMNQLGREGYRLLAQRVMESAKTICEGIRGIEGIRLLAEPDMSLLAFTSDTGNIYSIGDAMAERGWHLDRLQFPEALHLTITTLNVGMEQDFIHDLAEIVTDSATLERKGNAARNTVALTNRLMRIFPEGVTSRIARKAGSSMTKSGKQGSQAALYGISASFEDRKNVRQLVENLLDGMF